MSGKDDTKQDHPSRRWGPEDQIGAGNLLGAHKVREAAKLIGSGEIVDLGFPYKAGMPLSPGRSFGIRMPGYPAGGPEGEESQTIWNDDFVFGEIGQIGTHMDALGHVGRMTRYPCGHGEITVYNDNKLSEIWSPYGLKKLGIENAPIFFTRGVLLDVAALLGDDLQPGFEITPDHLRGCIDRQGLDPENWLAAGEVALIRTGHGKRFFTHAETWYDGAPGIGIDAARFISQRDPVVVGADNFAVEVVPSVAPEVVLPCHQHLIMESGIYLHEGMNLETLSARKTYEFVYAFAPLKIVGATGSPGTPFAIL